MPTEYFKPGLAPYTLGRGRVLIRKESETSWKDTFHVKEFKVNITSDPLEHENMSEAVKIVDRTAILKTKAAGSFIVDVPAIENVKLFLLGKDPTTESQSSGSWTAQSFTVVKAGEWQELGKRGLTITQVTDDTSPTPVVLVQGTDYYIEPIRGLFLAIPGGALTDADVFKVTGTYATNSYKKLKGGEDALLKRHVWFIGDPAEGVRQDIKGYCLLRPNGNIAVMGDDWENFTFEMSFQQHPDYGKLGFEYHELEIVSA